MYGEHKGIARIIWAEHGATVASNGSGGGKGVRDLPPMDSCHSGTAMDLPFIWSHEAWQCENNPWRGGAPPARQSLLMRQDKLPRHSSSVFDM